MRLELAERLRCPQPHVATPLVVVAQRTVERELLDGFAGCPVCHLEARFVDGDLVMPGAAERRTTADDARSAPPATSAEVPRTDPASDLLRLVALLGLAEPGGAVLLTGSYAQCAAPIVAAVDVRVVVVGAVPERIAGVSAVHIADPALPFGDATFRAAAIAADTPLPLLLDVLRAVAPDGRVVGRLPLHRPEQLRELARDEREWVGEVERGAGGIVPLRRA